MSPVVFYFGGNGHATWRLAHARRALDAAGQPFRFVEAAYPGFEGRPSATDFDAFIDVLVAQAAELEPALVFATGIGGLIALCLRSLDSLREVPLCLHAPVLWGLEERWMPRVLRIGPLRKMLPPLFAAPWYQRRFVRKQFVTELSHEDTAAFFDGYARCEAFSDLFDWLTPPLLRQLEERFAADRSRLERISLWWGSRDHVVTPAELAVTERALGVSWPLEMFEDWAHYPMIEAPESFVRALAEAVEAA